jgi:Transposase DDE domain
LYLCYEVLINIGMQTKSSLPIRDFDRLLRLLIPARLLSEIFSVYGPAKRRPPKLSAFALIKAMLFHFLHGEGTLAQNVRTCTGKAISDSALSQRRSALGFEPFYWILQAALRPRAHIKQHPEAFYKGKRLVALDGTRFSVANTPQISGVMFKPVARRFRAAFAKVGACVLVELGLRNPLAASIGIADESETALADELIDQIPDDSLTLGDRHYGVRPVIERFFQVGRDFLFRVKSNFKRRLVDRYGDGSALVELKTDTAKRLVREIIGKVKRPSGKWVEVRLWTSLLDWRNYPAAELLELYGKRWEQELFYRELKLDVRSHPLLQSHTPETAAQEVATLLVAQAILVQERIEAARLGKVEVLRISFRKTLSLLEPLWMVISCSRGILTDAQIQAMSRRLMREIAEYAILPRRKRWCPRAVRQPVSSWPRLVKNSYQNGPTQFKVTTISK